MARTDKPERKSISVIMDYPVNMDEERIHLYRKTTAEKIADMFVRELYDKIGPNYFEVLTGWIHQPGDYRIRIDFTINKELIGGPYAVNG